MRLLRLPVFFLLLAALAASAQNSCVNDYCTNPCPKPTPPQYSSCPGCCENMGGIHYCDSSAGRFVCKNGYYSSCYCTRHAVMDLQKLEGCCLWKGGVLTTDIRSGLVICNNGGVSEVCSLQTFEERVAAW